MPLERRIDSMATVFIEKREGKRGIKYAVRYKDPVTFKNKFFKTCVKRRDAQSEANKLREILDKGKLPENPKKKRLPNLTFFEVAQKLDAVWLEKLSEKELSPITYDGYKLRLDLLVKVFRNRLLCDINESEVKALRLSQFTEKSAVTSNRNLFILKQVFKLGLALKAVRFDVTKDINYLSEQEHERNSFLEPDDIGRLVEASQETRAKFYLPALIYLGSEHGASKQEALSLLWDDINFDYQGIGLIKLFRSKNTHKRTEFLMPRTREALFSWRDHLVWMRKRKRILILNDDFVFCRLDGTPIKRFDSAWRNVCRVAGIKNFHYHDLRHTFCSNLILSGSDLKEVKDMIGHRELSTTDRYSHLTAVRKRENQERLAEHYSKRF
jgi:site-specific recombinase XerD